MKRFVRGLSCVAALLLLMGTLPAAAQPLDEAVTYDLAEHVDRVKLLGRTEVTDEGIVPHTTGAGIAFYSECGGDITLTVTGSCDKFDEQYFAVYVDGEFSDRAVLENVKGTVTQTLTVAEDLEAGMHRIEICRETEEVYAQCVFEDVTLAGTLIPVPQSPLLIEFIGDSLTCGYASYPKPADKSALSVEHPYCEIGTRTFAYLAAKELGADFQSVCASGYGVVTGWNADGVTLPDMYDYTCYYHDTDEWGFERPADVVVINLGTNDNTRKGATGFSDEEIVAGMKAFMQQVRGKNPEAEIVWATGMAGTYFADGLQTSIDELGGAEAGYYYCELPYGTSGYAGHPSPEEHATAGEAMAAFLKETVLPDDYARSLVTVKKAQKVIDSLPEADAARLQLECDIAADHPDEMTGILTALYNAVKPEGYGETDIVPIAAIVAAVVIAALVVFAIVCKPKKKSNT